MPRRSLAEYEQKRDFEKTPEPSGRSADTGEGPLIFVVHKHDARRLHYDIRLELDGVLLSFPVPKGPSATIGERRLAVRTEDHPLDYASFEGMIPRGEYGAGSSILWDAGTYSPDEEGLSFDDREEAQRQMREGLERGKLSVTFRGRKLKGSWAFVKTKENWLLLKHRDAAANAPVELVEDAASVVSGLTNDQMAAGQRAERRDPSPHYAPPSLPAARKAALTTIAPMLASAGKPIPGEGWSYEPKLDGMRVLAYLDHGTVRLISRGGIDVTRTYPGVAGALAAQPAATLVLDGEVVAVDEHGRPSFEVLQQRINLRGASEITAAERTWPVYFYAFDIVHLDGYDLSKCPLWQRREVLWRVLLPTPEVLPTAVIALPPDEAYNTAVSHGFEGIIAKRDESRYEPGKRSDSWRKRKATNVDVFVIAGWTPGKGSRGSSLGGLVLAERDANGTLHYRGRVGSGFDEATLADLRSRLDPIGGGPNPFGRKTPEGSDVTWVQPEIEVLVEYAERTSGGQLRAPVFRGFPSAADGIAAAPQDAGGPEVIRHLERGGASARLSGEGWELGVTNLDKEMWPPHEDEPAVTKRDLLVYSALAWPHARRHLEHRLLTLTRMPNGIHGKRFYQRHWSAHQPGFVETVRVFSEGDNVDKDFLLCNNLPTLLWLGQLADLEWHVGLARTDLGPDAGGATLDFDGTAERLDGSVLNRPDVLLIDLDPYIYRGDEKPGEEPKPSTHGFEAAKEAAFAVKELLDSLSLPCFVKTSGATGLHLFVPMKRTLEFDSVRAVAQALAAELVGRHSGLLTTEWESVKRRGKVFVDANQNARHKALAAAYSPRSHPGAPVSTPVTWKELPSLRLGQFTLRTTPARLESGGDPWATIRSAAVDLRERLGLD